MTEASPEKEGGPRRRDTVFLFLGREGILPAKHHAGLALAALLLLGLRDRSDEVRFTAAFDDDLRGLAIHVQLPVVLGDGVGGIENRSIEKPSVNAALAHIDFRL